MNNNLISKEALFQKIDERVQELKITKVELSRKTNINLNTIKKYVPFSDAPMPSLDNALKIANALEISLDELCGNNNIYPIEQEHDLQALLYNLSLLVQSDILSIQRMNNQYVLTSDDKNLQSFLSVLSSSQQTERKLWDIIKTYEDFSILNGNINKYTNEEMKIYYLLKPLESFQNKTVRDLIYERLTSFTIYATDKKTDDEIEFKLRLIKNKVSYSYLEAYKEDEFFFRLIKNTIKDMCEYLEINFKETKIPASQIEVPDISFLNLIEEDRIEDYLDDFNYQTVSDLVHELIDEIKKEKDEQEKEQKQKEREKRAKEKQKRENSIER